MDGVSLTVATVDANGFTVSLIPETLEGTTLGAAAPGHPVNLQVEVLAKYVEKLTRAGAQARSSMTESTAPGARPVPWRQ